MASRFLVLTGPTAAGKTAWLLRRARHHPMLVVSADSRQVYLYMDIGTGKPSHSEQKILPHYVINCINPSIYYSAYQYLIDAAIALRAARERDREVWVCGGTGLYIRALVEKLSLGERPRPELRRALQEKLADITSRQAAAELRVEPVDPDNPVRVIRAAELACADPLRAREIFAWAGLTDGNLIRQQARDVEFEESRAELAGWECAGIASLDPGRDELAAMIERRVSGMYSAGLVEELAKLRELGYGGAAVVRDGIGYREAGLVVDGALELASAIERTVVRTQQYAKRQRTYIRGRGWPTLTAAGLDAWVAGMEHGAAN